MTAPAIVKERPLICTGESVRGILDGRKTHTRRVLTVLPRNGGGNPAEHYTASARVGWFDIGDEGRICYGVLLKAPNGADLFVDSPYGMPGERLWVREAWSATTSAGVVWRADNLHERPYWSAIRWRPSIHMPRWASRLTLEITGIRVERLQDISDADALAEGVEPWGPLGVEPVTNTLCQSPRAAYRRLWDSLNAKRGYRWDVNPWVWVIEFRKVTP